MLSESITFKELLEAKKLTVLAAKNTLCRVWRKVFHHIKISDVRWNAVVDRYYLELAVNEEMDVRVANNLRGNHLTAFLKNKIQWANFIKGIHVLGHEAVKITFTAVRDKEVYTEEITLCTKAYCKENNIKFGISSVGNDILKINNVWSNLKGKLTKNKSWQDHLKEYSIKKAKASGDDSVKKAVTIRHNHKKKLQTTKSNISWEAFEEGLFICCVEELHFNLELTTLDTVSVPLLIKLVDTND